MSSRQLVAIIAPPIVVAVMIPVFRVLVNTFEGNWRIGWYLGLVVYWITWCGIMSWLLIGATSIRQLIKPQRLTLEILFLLLVPLIGAGLYRLVPGMEYDKPQAWIFIMLLSTNLGNGFFEELLWRGAYPELFPDNLLLGMIWPTLWFALWHYAPGSVNPSGNAVGLMVGSGMMGFYLSFLARRTGTIWWTVLAHAIGGFIMIL
jgi:membrane protease YdiL (CAAX protease family)